MIEILEIKLNEKDAKIYLENKEVIILPLVIYYEKNLSNKKVISKEDYKEIIKLKDEYEVKKYLVYLISRKDYSTYELTSRLIKKFELSKEEVEVYLKSYVEKGIINNSRYLKERIYSLILRNYGYHRLLNYFENQGFTKEEFFKEYSEEFKELEYNQALNTAKKYLKNKNKPLNTLRNGLLNRLNYSGYEEEIIEKVLKESGFQIINEYF